MNIQSTEFGSLPLRQQQSVTMTLTWMGITSGKFKNNYKKHHIIGLKLPFNTNNLPWALKLHTQTAVNRNCLNFSITEAVKFNVGLVLIITGPRSNTDTHLYGDDCGKRTSIHKAPVYTHAHTHEVIHVHRHAGTCKQGVLFSTLTVSPSAFDIPLLPMSDTSYLTVPEDSAPFPHSVSS